jgi:hypothetical protein
MLDTPRRIAKHKSDALEEKHAQPVADPSADAEDPDEYRAFSIFWVPPRRAGYPPDKQERATQTVLEQAALLSAEWAA